MTHLRAFLIVLLGLVALTTATQAGVSSAIARYLALSDGSVLTIGTIADGEMPIRSGGSVTGAATGATGLDVLAAADVAAAQNVLQVVPGTDVPTFEEVLPSTVEWTVYRDTDLTGASGVSPWTASDGVGSSTWTTVTGTITTSSGLVLTPGAASTNYGGSSFTGAAVRTPISYLPSYAAQRVAWVVKIAHSVTPPGTAGQYMSPATCLLLGTAANSAKYAGIEAGGDGSALKVQPRYHDGSDRQGTSLAPGATPTWIGVELAPGGMRYRPIYGSPVGSPGTWTPADLTTSMYWYPVALTAVMGPEPAYLGISASRGSTSYTATIQEVAVFTGAGGM